MLDNVRQQFASVTEQHGPLVVAQRHLAAFIDKRRLETMSLADLLRQPIGNGRPQTDLIHRG